MSGDKSAGMSMSGMDMDMDMGGGSSISQDSKDINPKSKSFIIAKRYCTQCHGMKSKNSLSTREWKTTLKRMLNYMKNQNKMIPDEYEMTMIEHYYGVE